MRRLVPVLACFVALHVALPRPAHACSMGLCDTTGLVPADTTTIPANAPAVGVWAAFSDVPLYTASDFQILDGTTPVPFTYTAPTTPTLLQTVVLGAPLVPGHAYTFTQARSCAATTHFTAGPVAPLPTTLGTLSAPIATLQTLTLHTIAPGCATDHPVVATTVSLALSADAAPWDPVLSYEVLVDGTPSAGLAAFITIGSPYVFAGTGSYLGRGEVRVGTVCDALACDPTEVAAIGALSQGMHAIVMRATIVGSTTTVESVPVDVLLSCPTSPPCGGDAGVPYDAGASDAGAIPVHDGGGTGGDAGATPPPRSGGCTVAPGAHGTCGVLLVALVATLATRRRAAG